MMKRIAALTALVITLLAVPAAAAMATTGGHGSGYAKPTPKSVQLVCPRVTCLERERAVRWQLAGHATAARAAAATATVPDIVLDYEPAFCPELTLYTDVQDPGWAVEEVLRLANRLQQRENP